MTIKDEFIRYMAEHNPEATEEQLAAAEHAFFAGCQFAMTAFIRNTERPRQLAVKYFDAWFDELNTHGHAPEMPENPNR